MTVQVGPGTQATESSLIEEEASALTHRTIQRSFPFAMLVCLLLTFLPPIRYTWKGHARGISNETRWKLASKYLNSYRPTL